MQERRVVVSRVIKSNRVLPKTKETPVERISRFVSGQKQVVAYPFSAELSVKALGAPLKNSKDPSADNKEKKKKAESKLKRYGKAIFDPKAKPKKGQYFETRARKINQDGQMGDVPNFGWLDPIKTVEPKNLVSRSKTVIAADKRVAIRKVPARKNPRTGAMEKKALGTTIGRTTGNIGQAAARAVGIIVDGNGKFRCPPGVPAANQFTDEVGSNCFDFSPLIARALVAIAQKFGQETMQALTGINSASPFERDDDYRLVPKGSSLRSSGGLRGTLLGPTSSRIRGSLLGPDGKPISTESVAAEDARAVTDELIAAERDLKLITGVVIDPASYDEEFEKALRSAFPDKSAKEIKKMAKIAADRERMKDKLRQEQRDAMAVVRSLGIEVDESDPISVQRGLALALNKMQEDGWAVNLDSYFGKGFKENPELALLEHRARLTELALVGLFESIRQNQLDGLGPQDIKDLEKKYGKGFRKRLADAVTSGANPRDAFPDDERAQTLLAIAQNYAGKARQYETGILMQLVNTRNNTPEIVDDLGSVEIVDPEFQPDTFNAEMSVRDGKLVLGISIHGALMLQPAESMKDSDNFLFEPAGGAGTEIEKLKRIGEVVTAENRAKLLGTYFDELKSFGRQIEDIKSGNSYLTQSLDKSFGGIALGQFVGVHELTHGRQLILAREVIMSRNPSMSNEEALTLAMQMVLGRTLRTPDGRDFDYGTIMQDPEVLRTAVSNMSEVIGFLIDNKVGGIYGPSHYYKTFYLNQAFSNTNNFNDLNAMYGELKARQSLVTDEAELQGLGDAIRQIGDILQRSVDGGDINGRIDMLLELKKSINSTAQMTYMEMQADLSAAVQLGLIEETPEIKTFLAPLSLGQDMPAVRASIVPPAPPPPPSPPATRREKLRKLARAAKKAKGTTMVDLAERVSNILDDIQNEYSFEDRGLMSTSLASAARFEGRGAVSRWGKQVRDASLMDATEEQLAIIEKVNWRLKHDIKMPINTDGKINEPKMRQRLLLGGIGDQWMADDMDNAFLPFVEVIDNSKLPNSVAAEIVVPSDIVGFSGENMQGRRFEVGTHFTGVLKDNESLGSAGGVIGQGDGQRLIVAVPEGYSGLPDYTPGTNKSEVGSIILPPGEIEIIGVREDGVAIGRVISQRSADDIIDAKKRELTALDKKLQDVGQRITVGKAINRLERRQGVRSLAALRSSGKTNDALPDADRTKIPADRSSKTQDILERLNARGIRFGKSNKKSKEEKRKQKLNSLKGPTNLGTIVERDLKEFESAEESAIRVSRSIDRAVESIKAGKLEGLAPEVAETLKDKSPEEIRQLLVESARSFVDGLDKRPTFRMRSTPIRDVQDSREIPFDGFLKTGVYKTTYDANEIGVASASGIGPRKEYETLLGIPDDADLSLRPAHGFFRHRDEIEFVDDWKKTQIDAAEKRDPGAVSFRDPDLIPPPSGSSNTVKDLDGKSRKIDSLPHQYGDTEIVLRTDAASRSVATMGDSLNGYRTPFDLDGSSTDDELLEAMLLNRSTALDKPGLSSPTDRRIANLLNASIGKNHAQTTDFSRPGDYTARDYVEAIVAGSFDMSDVEEIRISPEFQDARTRILSVKAKDVGDSDVRELLASVLPEEDIDAAIKLISETQTKPEAKEAAILVRELVASRLSLVRERSSRRDIRRQVAQRSSGDRVPKVTFLNREGINIDDHRTFKRTSDALAMGEEHEIDDIIKYGTAQKVREQLSAAEISTSPQESFAAMKPKPTREPSSGLRSSGSARSDGPPPRSRTEMLAELNRDSGRGQNRRLARRADLGKPQSSSDSRSATMARQGRENTTGLAQRAALRSGSSSIPTDEQQAKRWQDYLDSLKIPDTQPRKVVEVETIEEAITALLDGHIVDMPDIEGAHTLLDELGRIVHTLEAMHENGEISRDVLENAVFDLCQVTVAGTSAFCLGNKGIPRYMMPQAEGTPIPGTRAARVFEEQKAKAIAEGSKVPKEVNGTDDFLAYLAAQGIKPRVDENGKEVGKETMPSDKLKATQRDMQGHKVVGMMESAKKGTFSPGKKPIFVSRDGYVVDGHHRWAAQLGQDFADGVLGNYHQMNVIVLDAPISEILRHANDWTDDFGIAKKTVAQKEDGGPTSRDILDIVKPKLVGEPNKIGQSIVKPADNVEARSLRSSGSTSVLSDGSGGGRSPFRTRGAGSSLRSSGATRSTDVKISEGPVNLPNGLDSQNLPKVLSSSELEQKFGNSSRRHKKYFARYGVKLKGDVPSNPVERESYYSSLQALDDLFQNVDPKKLLKGQKIDIEIGSNVQMLSGESGVIGEFNRSRRVFFTAGPQKGQIRIDTEALGKKGSEVFQNPNRYRNALQNAGLPDFVSRLFINQEAMDSFDAENEITRRLSYASMVHEFGHLLDYIAVKKEDKIRWRSAIGSMIFGNQDEETLRRGTMMSASIENELNELPSVSVYGQSSPQEKMAEGFAAWWLFSKRPDIQIMGTTTEKIVQSLLEELGPRVKSAKQPSKKKKKDVLPSLVTLYALLPFMIEGGENR